MLRPTIYPPAKPPPQPEPLLPGLVLYLIFPCRLPLCLDDLKTAITITSKNIKTIKIPKAAPSPEEFLVLFPLAVILFCTPSELPYVMLLEEPEDAPSLSEAAEEPPLYGLLVSVGLFVVLSAEETIGIVTL
jgi:hypothetical protein